MKRAFIYIVALFTSSVMNGQILYSIVDDFNRANSYTLGTTTSGNSTWSENEEASHPEQLQVNSNLLSCITGGVTGLEPTNASIDLTQEMPSFDLGGANYGWSFHFDLNRAPTGWSADRYSAGYILAANENNFASSTVDGWAVLWTYTSYELVLGRFANGITGYDPLTVVIHTGLSWSTSVSSGVNVRVEADADGNWDIWWEPGAPLSDPYAIDAYSASSAGSDNSYFSDPGMKYSGPAWSHNTSSSAESTASFDDISFGQESQIPSPLSFSATTVSSSQVNLAWTQDPATDGVVIAQNSENIFGTPVTGTQYALTSQIPGGGAVVFSGSGSAFSHSGLSDGTTYYYKIWSFDGSYHYSPGLTDNATTLSSEPSGQPSGLAAEVNGGTYLTVAWTDSGAENYLIKGSDISPADITNPTDFAAVPNGPLVRNVAAGTGNYTFHSLAPGTEYFFKIFPYNGTGSTADYKTDCTVPLDSATTGTMDLQLLISEVSDPVNPNQTRFMEIYNAGNSAIDFAETTIYACRQSNGGATWYSVQLTGSATAGATYVIALNAAYYDTAYDQTADLYSDLLNVNGNDGLFLYYNGNYLTGTLLDAFGVVNEDGTGKAWYYEDGHAVRRRSVSEPKASWDASEWVILRPLNHLSMTPGAHVMDVTWQGTLSGNWNSRGANWTGPFGFIPDASYNVTVPAATPSPVISQPSACNLLNIAIGASLSLGSCGNLIIVGNTP